MRRQHGDVSFHLVRRTARAQAARLNRLQLEERRPPRFEAKRSGRRLYRWKVIDHMAQL